MHISHDIRAAGMAQKSQEFVDLGSSVYVETE